MVVDFDAVRRAVDVARETEKLVRNLGRYYDFNRLEREVQPFLDMQKWLMTPTVSDQLRQTLDLITLPDIVTEVNRHRRVLESADARNLASAAVEKLLPRFDQMASVVQYLQPPRFDSAITHLLEGKLAFEAALPHFSNLAPLIEQHRLAILTAPDEPSRRERLSLAFAAVKGATGIELPLDSPERVVQFVSLIFVTFMMFLWTTINSQRAELSRIQDVREQRTVQRAQAETIAALSESLRQLQEQVPALQQDVVLEVSRDGILREGPAGSTRRIARLRRGARLKLLQSYERWRYVEVLDADGDGTEVRGWVYRKTVRLVVSR